MKKVEVKSFVLGVLVSFILIMIFGFRYGDASNNDIYDLLEKVFNKLDHDYYNNDDIYTKIEELENYFRYETLTNDDINSIIEELDYDIMDKLNDIYNRFDDIESAIKDIE